MGFSEDLVNKLAPYTRDNLGTGKEAQNYLKEHPLEITREEQKTINKAAQKDILDQVSKQYDRWVTRSPYDLKRFNDLPSEAQTAIVSIAYQYGPYFANGKSETGRKVWRQLVRQNWSGASDTLIHWQQKQPGDIIRRRAEARWLASIKH